MKKYIGFFAIFLLGMAMGVVSLKGQAIEKEIIYIPYPIAVDMAITHAERLLDYPQILEDLEAMEADLRLGLSRAERNAWTISTRLDFVQLLSERMSIPSNPTDQEILIAARQAMKEIEQQLIIFHTQQEIAHGQLENTLRGLIVQMADANRALSLGQKQLAQQEESLRHVRIRYQFGLVSSHVLAAAYQALSLEQMGVDRHYRMVENARTSLNYFLGQPLTQYTVIPIDLDQLGFDFPTSPDAIQYYIDILTMPQIRRLQLDVDQAHRHMEDYRGTDRETRDALQAAYDHATAVRDQAIHTMEVALIHGFNQWDHLKTQRASDAVALFHAHQALDMANTNFRLGRITSYVRNQAEIPVRQAEERMLATMHQQWLLAFRLQHPFLLG